MRRVLVLVCLLFMLTGCSKETSCVKGFMTIDGQGISDYPFSVEVDTALTLPDDYNLVWTALPIEVYGTVQNDNSIRVDKIIGYDLLSVQSDEVTAYTDIIQYGYQERFEDLWCDVYDRLNGMSHATEELDIAVLQDILQHIYGEEKYGDLRDTITDCLMVVKHVNDGEITDELNTEAGVLYNKFYAWLRQFSIDKFQ